MRMDVASAMRGDREAFARLYRAYARPVFLDLVGRLGRRHDAEDVLQQAFVKAWTSLPSLRSAERFVPWLFRIARNEARDHVRRAAARPLRLHDVDLLAATGRSEQSHLDAVRELVAGLKPKTRAIVLLRAVEGWSAREVARAQSMSEATVRRHYSRALDHLRQSLTRSRNDDEGQEDGTTRRLGV